VKGRDAHQSGKFEMRKRHHAFRQLRQIRIRDSAFRLFAAHVDFDEDTKFLVSSLLCLCAIEPLSQRPIVDRIHRVEGLGGASGFVALQMADEMPGSLEVGDCGEFPLPFLNAVFAKVAEPGIIGFANRLRRVRFGDADQKNLFGFSGGATRGRFDLLANLLKIFPDVELVAIAVPVKS